MYTAHGRIEKSHLFESYLPIVRRIAMQMMTRLPANVELDDLIQAGRIGLMEAWDRYQEGAEASFDTFATQRIRGAMLDELRAMDWVPRRVRKSARQVEQAIQAAAHRAGRTPTETEIARELGVPLAEYHELLVKIQGCQLVYAEDFGTEDSDRSLFDERADIDNEADDGDPMALLVSAEFRSRLVAAISQLPEREARVLSLHYEENLNLREISMIFEVNPSRISQLHSQAIARLRALLAEVI
jgi:RNA polymerase sigma factor FliA